jgi:hypothetical protein
MKILTYDIEMNRTSIFIRRFPKRIFETRYGILGSPVSAFHFAQLWESAKAEGVELFDKSFRKDIARPLARLAWARQLQFLSEEKSSLKALLDRDRVLEAWVEEESSLKALDSYLEVLSLLLKQWRACNQDPVRWWKAADNQEQVVLVSRAVASISHGLLLTGDPKPSITMTMAFGKEQEKSLLKMARTAAYVLFSDVLVENQKFQFCSRCEAVFLPCKKQKYCSKQCGHIDSGLQSKRATLIKLNRDRVREASKAVAAWIDRGAKRDWRGSVEKALFKKRDKKGKGLINGVSRKSQWLGRCIRAAGSPDDSPQRARLVELCTGPGLSEEERKKVSKDLNAFYALIQQAQSRERRFKAKRATAPAANAARRPKAGLE